MGADERAEQDLAHGTAASTEARMMEAAGLGDQQAMLDSEELQLFRHAPMPYGQATCLPCGQPVHGLARATTRFGLDTGTL